MIGEKMIQKFQIVRLKKRKTIRKFIERYSLLLSFKISKCKRC